MKKQCSNCYYNGACSGNETCDDYVTIIEEENDAYVLELIESERIKYYKEWSEYLNENQIDFF